MDQHARFRTRGIRTIGKLSTPADDDILLAQWPQPMSPALQRQDVAISSDWQSRQSLPIGRNSHQVQENPVALFDAYDQHQRYALQRLLEAIDAEVEGREAEPLVFEPPTLLPQELLMVVRRCRSDGRLSPDLAAEMERRVIASGEWVVRCWALIELYRADLITVDELRSKRASIEQEARADTAPLV